MLDLFTGPGSRTRDGLSRRNFLRVGALALGGLAMPDLLRLRAAESAPTAGRDTAVILLWLGGGPSHLDMYDMKPGAPAEVRGEFRPIHSSLAGLQVCEHLPLQARVMHRVAVLRSVTHRSSGHSDGAHTMLTGHAHPVAADENINPHVGSVASRLAGPRRPDVPAFVNVLGKPLFGNAAYLGAGHNTFSPSVDPLAARVEVKPLKLHHFTSPERFARRNDLLRDLDTLRRDVDRTGEMGGLDEFYGRAMQIILSERALRAFDLGLEDNRVRDAYGRNRLGQSCLMARRLVEAGVTFVTVYADGWDTHDDNFNRHRRLFVEYDRALAALVNDLYDRGLDRKVLLVAMGEFGRTPQVNPQAGRDHWPEAASALFVGGGLRMGQVIGATDARAAYPTTRPLSPGDVLSTIYHVLGVDWRHEFHDQARRPLRVVPEGGPIRELIG